MSFLSAAFLLALPVALTPLLIHLLRRRNVRVIPWGAMQFLSDQQGQGRRLDALEEKLLLALRVLVLLAFVLALARPQVTRLFGGGTTAVETFIVVDDSLSTSLQQGRRTGFDTIRAKAREMIADAPPKQPVRVLMAASGPRWLGGDNPTRRQILEELDQAKPTEGAADFPRALAMTTLARPADSDRDRHVIVLTDSQARGWQASGSSPWGALQQALDKSRRRNVIDVINVTEAIAPESNLCVQRVGVDRSRVAVGESVSLTAEVVNLGTRRSGAAELEWRVDGEVVESTTLSALEPSKLRGLGHSLSFDATGVHDVTARVVSDDSLPADNTGGVTLQVINSVPVLIVSDSRSAGAETAFITAAFGVRKEDSKRLAAGGESGVWTSLFQPEIVSMSEAETHPLETYHAVMVLTPQHAKPVLVKRLEAYVHGGGGLWVMLDALLDPEAFNQSWRSEGTGLFPRATGKLIRPRPGSPDSTVHPPKSDHPATSALSDTQRLDIDRVRLLRYHAVKRSGLAEATVLLESGGGQPLALHHNAGAGRAILQTLPLLPDWSTLTTSKAFVVMVQEWLAHLSQGSATRLNLQPRESLVFRLPSLVLDPNAAVVDPLGRQGEAALADTRGVATLRYGRTALPGRYELAYDDESGRRTVPFRVERPSGESDLTPLTQAEKMRLQEIVSLEFVETPRTDAFADSSVSRRPVWWPLLLAMISLMAAESLLAVRLSRQRFGAVA